MNFSNMRVSQRLYMGFGLILAILVVVTAVAVIKVQAINGALTANSREHAPIQRYAINFRGSAHDRAIAIRDVVLSATLDDRQKEEALIVELAKFYANSAGPLEQVIASSDNAQELNRLYGDIKAIEARAVATTQAIIAKVAEGDSAAAQTLLWTQAKPEYVAWLGSINKLIDSEEARIQGLNQLALREAGGFLAVMLIALAVALVCGVVLAWAISRSVVNQLGAEPQALGDVAKRVAEGDLHPVQGHRTSRTDSVLASLMAMQSSLAGVVRQVRQASDAIASGSSEIASGNADLSRRTEEQVGHLQNTSASMEQMNAAVRSNAETARQATQLAASASTAAEKGGDVVSQVVKTMEEITASSKKIGDIISVIDGIAFQTNILALNAAVEAARAGEQGRGFAVVAGEVRSLAQRSAEAAREIKGLIESSMERVEVGSQLVGHAGTTMEDIVNQVRRVSDLINEISASTIEQTSGIGQVTEAVTQLDQSTQQNAAMVEQSAAAAESLRQEASRLAEVVRIFRLDGGGADVLSAQTAGKRLPPPRPAQPTRLLKHA
jgi:methyl-accepting chemotaxis protein